MNLIHRLLYRIWPVLRHIRISERFQRLEDNVPRTFKFMVYRWQVHLMRNGLCFQFPLQRIRHHQGAGCSGMSHLNSDVIGEIEILFEFGHSEQ